MMNKNIFNSPKKYLEQIIKTNFISFEMQNRHTGESVAVVFLTKYCGLGCDFCIYKSKPKNVNEIDIKNEFSKDGCQRIIQFINESNIGYLLIAGGGEPFEKEEYIYQILKNVNVEKIVIATNGFWTLDKDNTQKIIRKINGIIQSNKYVKDFVIRFSIDMWHQKKVPLQNIIEFINVYNKIVDEKSKFKIEIHTIVDDNTVQILAEKMGCEIITTDDSKYVSDNKKIHKKSKKRSYIKLDENNKINIGYAKLFYPNLKINLNDSKKRIEKVLQPFYEDVINSQDGNFSTVTNENGTFGLDYLINFNGNVSTWGNYQLEKIPNLYHNTNKEISDLLYNDIISYSYIDLNLKEREEIIKEVNPIAVTRSASINVRDYSGSYLIYEDKTALYYVIMIIKLYMEKGIIKQDIINKLPRELSEIIYKKKENIIEEYKKSNYSIIKQYIDNKEDNIEKWAAILYLVNNGHFIINEDEIDLALKYINFNFKSDFKNIKEILNEYDNKIYSTIIDIMTIMPKNKKIVGVCDEL